MKKEKTNRRTSREQNICTLAKRENNAVEVKHPNNTGVAGVYRCRAL
jgi:hypothetical protein